MAQATIGGPMTMTATAQDLATLLGQKDTTFVTGIIRADPGNAGTIYGGNSSVTGATNCQFIMQKGEWISIDLEGSIHTAGVIYLVGTPADKAYLFGVTR